MRRTRLGRVVRGVVIAGILAWSLGPVVLGVLTSLSTQAEVQAGQWLPSDLSLGGYRTLLAPETQAGPSAGIPSEVAAFGRAVVNSAILTVETTIVLLLVSITAAYAFSRLRFPGRRAMFVALVGTLIIPVLAVVAPLFRIMANLRLIGTNPGLMLIYVSANAPLAVWLLYNHTRDMPHEVEEAALTDGCGRWQAMWRVVIPQMRSGIAAVAAIMALSVWGEFFIPLLFAPTLATKPVTVLITEFVGKYTTNQPLLAAAGILTLIPPAIVAIALSRYIRGLLAGWHG